MAQNLKNQTEQILKVYQYRGAKIFVIQVGESVFQYFFVWRNQMYHDWHWIDQTERVRLSKKETGGVLLMILAEVESRIDLIVEAKSFFPWIISKLKKQYKKVLAIQQ